LDVKQLRALLAIAETGSVTRAAELLHIVQPAVSRQLRLLEEDLGTELFSRGKRGMELTISGKILVDHARRALRELDQAKAEIVPTPGVITGLVNIGLLPSVSDLLAAPLVKALKSKYPQLSLRTSIGYAGYLQQWLENGEVDVALMYDPTPSTLLEVQPLLEEKIYLVGPADAGLRLDHPITLEHLSNVPLILPSEPHGLRILLAHACAVAGVSLNLVTETNAMNIQKDMVTHGLGFTVLPSAAIFKDLQQGSLTAAPIHTPDLRRKIVLALPMTRRSSVPVRCVANELRSQVRALVQEHQWPGASLLCD
jgi:LysR family nitrogen assimilation transcriptional regulator